MVCAVVHISNDQQMQNVDRAVLSAFEAVKDFAGSDVGRRLTPKQFLAAVSIAAVEQANRMGLPGASASMTLRDVADGVAHL